jgi:hypothetical protein
MKRLLLAAMLSLADYGRRGRRGLTGLRTL